MKKFYFSFSLLCFALFSLQSFAAQTNSQVTIKLDLLIVKQIESSGLTQLILPVPQTLISNDASLQLASGIKNVKAKFSIVNTWVKHSKNETKSIGNKNDLNYIRLLLIEVKQQSMASNELTLSWNNHQKNQLENVAALNQKDVTLLSPSPNWLAQALLLHPEYSQEAHEWYIEPQKKYAYYVTNQGLLSQQGYPPNNAGQWLYDRPQAIFQLFIMSGEQHWLVEADGLSFFYQQHIDSEGQFTLKKRFDAKYLMPKGLLYDYLLSGSEQAKNTLKRVYQASLDWDEHYNKRTGFWTERNQAAALNTAISYWEVTNDEAALIRINNIIDATVEMTFNPVNNWPLRGCPQHSYKSHEGQGGDSPTCSPWMMALLGDALWRFYQLTQDIRSAALLDAFGDFILNHGLFYGNNRVNNIVIPKYLVVIENPEQETLDQWSAPQHACDVAALIGKSTYIKEVSGNDSFMMKTLFSALLEQCQGSYVRLKKEQKSMHDKKYWLLKPPRRFGWMYSTTSDLPWLKKLLLNDY